MGNKNIISVLGGGSWATALIKMLSENTRPGEKIWWYMRSSDRIEYIRNHDRNPKYLSSVRIDNNKVNLCDDINEAVRSSDIVILAIPSAFLKNAFNKLETDLKGKIIVSAIKGIVPDDNLIIADFLNKNYNIPYNKIGVVAGPCHAEEVALERLSYLSVAAEDLHIAEKVAVKLESLYIKTNISDDIFGTEYSAVLKNVFAIASGICHGLGYGDNFQAVLVSNAIREIKRFADTVHPINRDIKSSEYLGDLLVTAYSKFSRNRIFGTMIGKGYSVRTAELEMNMIAEGYYAVKSITEINSRYNIFMPITEAVYNILYQRKPPAFEIKLLTDKLR
ncbi:MAG: NAD(P)-binding domain-containing protein [bacterium]|nr:NAD(P)-binding domain-containing protein [bacterium]